MIWYDDGSPLMGFVLADNLLEQSQVGGKGIATAGGQMAGRERTTVAKLFGDGHKASILQGSNVCDDVPIGHLQRVAELREGQFRAGGQQGHNSETPFFVDDLVELEKRLGVHGRRRLGSHKPDSVGCSVTRS